MTVYVFVEGVSDCLALNELWTKWRESLRHIQWRIQIIPFDGKSKYFRKIGPHAAEKLAYNDFDLVVGLPDMYPNRDYESTCYRHNTFKELQDVQYRLVKDHLTSTFQKSSEHAKIALNRFLPTALKHDAEMLLLAAREALRSYLGTPDQLGSWICPVESQNQTRPPKRIVEDLFQTRKKRRYRETIDAKDILTKVSNIQTIFYANGQLQCPVFKEMMDWIAQKTGVDYQ